MYYIDTEEFTTLLKTTETTETETLCPCIYFPLKGLMSGRYSFFGITFFQHFPVSIKAQKGHFLLKKRVLFRKNTLLTPRNLAQELCLSSV